MYFRCAILREDGNKLFNQQRYRKAIEKYKQGMRALLGDDASLPSTDYLNEKYLTIEVEDWKTIIDLVACAANIAQCYNKLGEFVEMIDWTEEVEIIYKCHRLVAKPNEPSWIDYHQVLVEYFLLQIKAQHRANLLFKSLGNSSLSMSYGNRAFVNCTLSEGASNRERILALEKQIDIVDMVKWRHPDPKKIYSLEMTQPALQIRGVWKKLDVAPGPKPGARSTFSSWVWKGRLYVAGGMTDLHFEHRDVWYEKICSKNMSWKKLPNMPPIRIQAGLSCSRLMKHWKDKAYLFIGAKTLWVFDLEQEKWNSIMTTFHGKWPYHGNNVTGFSSEILEGKLYIFGGDDENTHLGTNIFMALDLTTLEWDHISGTSANVPKTREPNLRVLASMWAVPAQRRLYLIFGDANRSGALRARKRHGNQSDFTYDDFWSFDAASKTWYRERLRGSFPAPRTEMAAIYNPLLQRAIVYGGYNASMSSAMDDKSMFHFSFFGDAFVMDPETKMWQHVITKGFPSYRAMAALCCDPETGVTYLYGGYTNTDYVPSKSVTSRVFGDIWQLKLDMAGGHLTENDLRRDARMETMGPWRRCFTCGECGTSYSKCGGTCGGQFFFCSAVCHKNGWKEHKETHGCKKK
ncbi:hypothetical protein DFH11DRAFT_1516950 [Phellopilus nigrolimitatus]|nr:hypothetical protein DFH11DRAFT_1516950 [Phellopilus nigrolimitatus]